MGDNHSVRDKTCRHMGYTFQLAAKDLYKHHSADRIVHTMAFVTPVAGMRNNSMGPP